MAGHGLLVNLLLGHDGIDRQSLIEEKDGPRSPTFAPVAAPLVYLLELAAFLIGERQCFGFAGQGEAFGRRGWQVYAHKSEDLSGSAYYELRQVEQADSEPLAEGDDEKRFLPLLKVFDVFNLDQVDGLPNEYRAASDTGSAWEPSDIAERIIECSGADIRHGGFRAFYSPPNDLIYLPLRSSSSFRDQASFYRTELHEIYHWAGHASCLGRRLGKRLGESAYAMEDLIAEMGAAFLAAHRRLEGQVRHANYIAS